MTKTQILELEKDFKAYQIKLFIKRTVYVFLIFACLGGGIYGFLLYKDKQNTLEIAIKEKNKMQEKLENAQLKLQKAQILKEKKPQAEPVREKIIIRSYVPNIANLEQNFHQKNDYKTALQIAELYFADKNFEKALKWSFKANELDKRDSGAWVLFAKAKFALGKKDEAKQVLQSFLRFYDDKSFLDEVGYILK